ncbi:MAG: FprA family A-type flavoprotein [Chitinivibrionales bacterium]|nr:FprA family A-type flavoprotein [Chitinivibrionales bacterium]
MSSIKVSSDIYWIGVNDRTTDLFEGLWPITQEGVSYNAYLINDEKKAIIDLAKAFKSDDFFDQIDDIVPLSEIDYVIINHMEPDHTGVLKSLKRMAPSIQFLGSPKTRKMLEDFYGITENIKEVSDGETLSLGKHTLKFFSTPFVHWPETMMTYEETGKILFSCDGFGGYGALRGSIFDDQCPDCAFYEQEALRYYSNIVSKYFMPVLKAINKLSDLPIEAIAPSHGLVWRKRPERIIELYQKWSQYGKDGGETAITLIYASMYGNTEKMMNAMGQGISQEGVNVEIFDAARIHPSYILPSLWAKKGVIVGTPTYEAALFPPVADLLELAARKAVKNKEAALFGSFGWSGGALAHLKKIVEPLKWNIFRSYEFPGGATKEDLKNAEELGAAFARHMKSL